jgi:hypothetical protein
MKAIISLVLGFATGAAVASPAPQGILGGVVGNFVNMGYGKVAAVSILT